MNKYSTRDGLKQRRTKETSTVVLSDELNMESTTQGNSVMLNQDLLIVDESQPTASNILNSEEIDEFFSITNADVKDVKKPKNAVLETFDPLNS